MPPVVIAAAIGMAAAGAAAAGWIAASTALIIAIGASVAGALLTKPPSFGSYTSQQERKQVLRSSTAPQAQIYGRTVTSGLLFFAEEEKGDSTKEWVHLGIALCGHEIDAVETVWLGDETIDTYGSNAQFEIHSNRQTADPFMLANCTSWKDDMIGKGITWARVSLKFDADKFPSGIPNIKFLIRGKKVYDPRNGVTAWSDNAALCIRDYYASYLSVDADDINDQQFIQAANICDQRVENNGTTRARYTINGTFDASEAQSAVLDDLHLACAGEPTFMAGQHGILVGAYYGPATMDLTEGQIVSDVQIVPEAAFGDKLNIVTGTFLDPDAQYAETEFPQVRVDQYVTEDGNEFVDDVKYRFVSNVYQAQQLAQIKINRTRIGRSIKLTMNLSGYMYRPGYYVNFTLDPLGISNQEFRITDWSINATKGVDVTLRQETPAVWLDIIGQPIERPDITDFPSQGIGAPRNLQFTVVNIGEVVQGRLTWINTAADVNYNIVIIRQNGAIVQTIQVPGETVDITGLPRGSYEMAVVSVNYMGQKSPEAMIVAEIHAPNTPTAVLMDNGYFEYTLKPQSSDLATVSVQYDFWTSGTTKLANTSDATVTGNATRKGIGKTWTETSDQNDRVYYWYIRAINAFGTSPFIEFAAHFEMEPGKAIDFIDDNIKGTDTYEELNSGIQDNSTAINNANETINNVKDDVTNLENSVGTINTDLTGIKGDITQAQADIVANSNAITQNVADTVANAQAIADNAADILANTGKINKEITDRTNAVTNEATTRANQIAQTAQTAADNLLNEKTEREAAITQTNTVVQNNYNSLATQIAQVSAGTGQQFDSARIYYFDNSAEGWSVDDGGTTPMSVTEDGWLITPPGNANYDARSSNDLGVNGEAYKFLKMRIKKVGTPNWTGYLYWIGATQQGWTNDRRMSIPQPDYDANGVSTIDLNDIPWATSQTIRRIRLSLSSNQTADNYYMIDFVAVGRPTPGASTAALEEERTARVTGDATEAAARQTLAAQVRGGYTGNDPSQLTSGLIYSERQIRITAEQAIASDVTALETDFNDNKAAVQQSLDTLTTQNTAQGNAITALQSSVAGKADASAVSALTTRVSDVEGTVTSQGNSITSLNSSLNTLKNQTSNAWLDGSFESYAAGTNLYGNDGKCVVITDQHYTGSKALKISRGANETGNSDKTLAVRSTIRENSYYKFELYALMPADQQPSSGWNCNVGFNLKDSAGNQSWPTGVNITEAALTAGGGRDKWVKFSGTLSAGAGKTDAAVWISPRGATGAGTPGYTLYIDQFTITDITEARAAQQTADANAQATSALETRVTQNEGNITTQGSQITGLRNDLTTVQGQVALKADASALATLSTKVDQQGSTITSQGQSITELNNSLDLSDNAASALGATPGNMLTNASFENMLDNWTISAPTGKYESISAQSPHSGARILRTAPDATPVILQQNIEMKAGRTYKYGGFVRAQSGTTLRNANNNKFRLGNTVTGGLIVNVMINPSDLPTGSGYKEYTGTYTPTVDLTVTFGIYSSLTAGYQYWDDVYVIDITAETLGNANAAATTALTTRVSNAEGNITSQGNSITQLRNDLTATNAEVATKASSAALTALQSTVTQQGTTITSQGTQITNLRNDLTTTQNQVNTKADAAALTALTNRVTSAEGNITSQSDQITQLSNNLMAGNLIYNGDVSANADGWATMGTGSSWVWDETDKAIRTTSGSIRVGNITKIPVEAGMQLNIQFDTRANTAGLATGTQQDLVGVIADLANPKAWLANAQGWLQGITTSYATKTATIKIPDNFTGSFVYLRFAQDGWTPNTTRVYIKNVVVTSATGIATKADATALTNLTSRVTTAEGNITSLGQSLTTLTNNVSGMQADLNIMSLMPGNLLANYSFENGFNGWMDANASVFSTIPAQSPHSGSSILNTKTGQAQIRQNIALVKDRTYKLGIFARRTTAATIASQGNHKLRIGDSTLRKEVPILNADVPTGNTFAEISSTWKCIADGKYDISLMSSLSAGDYYFDDMYIIDITDQLDIAANASATTALTTRVTTAEGTISSQGQSITTLTNGLNAANTEINKKADQTAVTALTGRVTQTETGLTAANSNITSLTAAVTAVKATAEDLISNPTFDPAYYQMGYTVVDSTTDTNVPAGAPFRYVAKIAARDHIPTMPNVPVREGDVFEITAMVAVQAGSTATFQFYVGSAGTINGGVNAAGSGGAVTAANGANWTKTTWRYTVTAGVAARGYMRPFLQINQSSPFGTVWYVTDWHCRNITNVKAVDDKATATATALDTLGNTVTQQGNDLTALSTRTTNLETGLATANNKINTKADSSALSALQSTVTNQGNSITSQGSQITTLNQRVSNYATDADVSKAQPGNMVVNNSFERDLDGWTNVGWNVYAAQGPHSGKNILRMNTSGDAVCYQAVTLKAGRTYRFGVWGRRNAAVVIANANNTKLSIRNAADVEQTAVLLTLSTLPTGSTWAEITKDYTPPSDGNYLISLRASISAGEIYLDDAYVIDITDTNGNAANASAITALTSRVTTAEGKITSQGTSITQLQNDLNATNNLVSQKANSSTVQQLQNTVEQQGNTLTSQGQSITQINNNITTTNNNLDAANAATDAQIFGNLLVNGSFERGLDGYTGATSKSNVVTLQKPRSGTKALALTPDTGSGSVFQTVNVYANRLYEISAWTKVASGTTMNSGTLANNKLRIGRPDGSVIGDKQLDPSTISTTDWQQTTLRWRPTTDQQVTIGIMWSLATGTQYYDDFTFIDITDRYDIDANASAVSSLTSRVTTAEGRITSQGTLITGLRNDLTTTQGQVNNKADASALQSLQNTVTGQGNTLTSQGQAITNLTNSLVLGNLIVNGDLKTNADNWQDSGTGSSFSYNTTDKAIQSGGNSIRVANQTAIQVEPGMQLTVSFEVKASVSGTAPTADTMGFTSSPAFNPATWIASQTGWLANLTTSFNTKTYTLVVPDNYTGRFLYLRFASGGGTPSNFNISIRNVVVTSSTGVSGKADASALTSLTSRVTTAEGKITANTNAVNSLTTRVGNAESAINGVNETVASLGLAQTTTFQQLRSMIGDNSASITTTSKAVTDLESSTADSISTLTTNFNGLNATVQQTSSAVADVNGKLSAQWGVKVETNTGNGTPRVAGIQLGIDATGSSAFLVKADTFGVYNPNASGGMNLAFAITGSQTYIREAFIQDGSITNAKIGNSIQSNNYVYQQSGWAINKDGNFSINGNTAGQGRMTMTASGLIFYDTNNVARVTLGLY